MQDDSLDRRAFVLAVGGGLSAAWIASRTAAVAAVHAEILGAGSPTALELFVPADAATVEAIAACIIPTDETPGAREAGVVRFIDRWLMKHEPESKPVYAAGLRDLGIRVKQQHAGNASFASLPEHDQVALLTGIQKSDFFTLIRTHAIMGYLGAPEHGGNANQVGWKAVGFENRGVWQAPFGWYDREGNNGH